MITEWHVKNFKSILDQRLTLAPLTIFCGVNSSGKSSFLQTIAMLAQSGRSAQEHFSPNGDLVNLGSFGHIYCKKTRDFRRPSTVELQFVISFQENKNILLELHLRNFMPSPDRHKCEIFTKIKYDKTCISSILADGETDPDSLDEIQFGNSHTLDYYSKFADVSFNSPCFDFDDTHFLPQKIKFKLIYIEKMKSVCLELLAKIPDHELTKNDALIYAEYKIAELGIAYSDMKFIFEYCVSVLFTHYYQLVEIFAEFKIHDTPFEFFSLDEYKMDIADWFYVLSKKQNEDEKSVVQKEILDKNEMSWKWMSDDGHVSSTTEAFELPKQLKEARDILHDFFALENRYDKKNRHIPRVEYLGPLRESPQYNYDKSLSDGDPKGGNTPSVLHKAENEYFKVIDYYSPSYFDDPKGYKPSPKDISEAMKEWLRHLGIIGELDNYETANAERTNDDNTETEKTKFYVVIDGIEFSLPQVGTGISQVIPILAKCLLSPPGSTIIVEQPESQLHPKMQSKLADFFIAMALSGRQCLIETHSEYMIRKLCYLYPRIPDSEEKDALSKLYFVEKHNGISCFEEISINKSGVLSDWPEGFFDESQKINRLIIKDNLRKFREGKQND